MNCVLTKATLEPFVGADIRRVIRRAHFLARAYGDADTVISFNFNGVDMDVKAADKEEEVYKRFQRSMQCPRTQ